MHLRKISPMKKYIPFLLIASIFLSACSIDWNGEKDKKIAELEKQIRDISFEKQKECGNLQNAAQEQISKNSDAEVTMIFYSPKRNSCLFTSGYIYKQIAQMQIHDFYTKEVIHQEICSFEK